jgi:thioredoxin 1
VHTIESKEEFDEELNTWPGLLIIKFEAEWCGPCKEIAPFVHDLAQNHPLVRFLKVDTDENEELMHRYKVSSLPFFLFVKSGYEIDRVIGGNRQQLIKKIQQHQQQSNININIPQLPEHEFFDIQFPDHDQWNLGMAYESRKFSYRVVMNNKGSTEKEMVVSNSKEEHVSVLHPAVTVNALFVTVQGTSSP